MNEQKLMNLVKGTKLICDKNLFDSKELELDKEYIFLGYDSSNIPVNNYSATMTWYPDKPIWSPEDYERIKFNFMMVILSGIEKPQPLKYFKIKEQ